MRKSLTVLLALILFLGVGPKSHAANTVSVEWNAGTGSVELELKNLEGSVYGLQLELTLEGSYPKCTFTAKDSTAYTPGCKAAAQNGKTSVTIYLTGRNALNNGANMTLGSLNLGAAVQKETMPDHADITILDRGLNRHSITGISVAKKSSSGTDSNTPSDGADTTDKPDKPDDSPSRPSAGTSSGNKRPASRPNSSKPSTSSKPGTPSTPSTSDTPDDVPNTPGNAGPAQPSQDSTPPTGVTAVSFTDVQPGDWFQEAVQFVQSRGMMNGTSADTFAPYAATSRAMIVTILHRMEESPAAGSSTFADVPAGEYYAAPVAWASEHGIVTGYSDSAFHPNTPITREQLAAILYRYAQYKNFDVSKKDGLTQFDDVEKVSPYAKDAFAWAVEAKLITGIGSSLDPAGSANRAQAAAVLMRLCTNVLGN